MNKNYFENFMNIWEVIVITFGVTLLCAVICDYVIDHMLQWFTPAIIIIVPLMIMSPQWIRGIRDEL